MGLAKARNKMKDVSGEIEGSRMGIQRSGSVARMERLRRKEREKPMGSRFVVFTACKPSSALPGE